MSSMLEPNSAIKQGFDAWNDFSTEAQIITLLITIGIFWIFVGILGTLITGLLFILFALVLFFMFKSPVIGILIFLLGMIILIFPALLFTALLIAVIILIALLVILVLI